MHENETQAKRTYVCNALHLSTGATVAWNRRVYPPKKDIMQTQRCPAQGCHGGIGLGQVFCRCPDGDPQRARAGRFTSQTLIKQMAPTLLGKIYYVVLPIFFYCCNKCSLTGKNSPGGQRTIE
jgi:hypothetical protein